MVSALCRGSWWWGAWGVWWLLFLQTQVIPPHQTGLRSGSLGLLISPPPPRAASCTEQPAEKEPLLSIPRTTKRHKAAFPLTSALCLTSQCLSGVLASQPHPDVATLRMYRLAGSARWHESVAQSPSCSGTAGARDGRNAAQPGEALSQNPFCSRILGRCLPLLPKSRSAQLEDGGIWGGFTRGGLV